MAGANNQPGEFASEVILEDIKVLTADQRADESSSAPEVAKAVTIEVSTEQAQKVALAQQVGTLYLLLRAAGDQENGPLFESLSFRSRWHEKSRRDVDQI